MTRRPWLTAALGSVAIVGSLWLLPTHGTIDVDRFWLPWMDSIDDAGVRQAYAGARSDYPPLAFVWLAAVVRTASILALTHHAALKLMLWAALTASAVIFYGFSRRTDLSIGLFAALMLNNVGLAYLDAFFVPVLLASFWAFRADRPALGLLLFVIACLTKFQPLILAPAVALFLFRTHQLTWRVAAPSAVLTLGTLAVVGSGVVDALFRAGDHRALSAQALNFWWIAGYVINVAVLKRAATELGLVAGTGSLLTVLKIAFAVIYGTALARRQPRDFDGLLRTSAAVYALYFAFSPGVHENHLLVLVVVLALLGSHAGEWRRFATFAVLANVNLWLFYGVKGNPPTWSSLIWISLVVAGAIVVATFSLWRSGAARRAIVPAPQAPRTPR